MRAARLLEAPTGWLRATRRLFRRRLPSLGEGLDQDRFWQIHRSVIVNHRHIAAAVRVDENNMHLRLRERTERLPVSRHFQHRFKGQ